MTVHRDIPTEQPRPQEEGGAVCSLSAAPLQSLSAASLKHLTLLTAAPTTRLIVVRTRLYDNIHHVVDTALDTV
jgi:hypothetical protein